MPEAITIKLELLTPLWTGDEERGGGRVRETGVLGSLRWWYEAIIRGVGRYACDPSNDPCVYEDKQGPSSICLACQLFGSTGYGRRFKLVVEGEGDAGQPKEVKLKNPGTRNHRGWRIPPKVAGPLTITLYPMHPNGLDGFEKAALHHAVHLIECYGALGAKTSHGQGLIRVTNWGALPGACEADPWIKAMKERPAKAGTNLDSSSNLCNFTGVTITVDNAFTSKANWWKVVPLTGLDDFPQRSWIPSAPAFRAQLRRRLRSNDNFPNFKGDLRNERHRLMGTIQGPVGPKGSDVFVSHLYKEDDHWSMRMFAFIPKSGNIVDKAVRALLVEPDALKPVIEDGLGVSQVKVVAFPTEVRLLLAGEGKEMA